MGINIKDFFNINDNVSDDLDEWVAALEFFDNEAIDGIEEDVWQQARESQVMPVMSNVIQDVVLNKLSKAICDHIIEESDGNVTQEKADASINYSVNGASTRFYIDGKAVAEEDEMKEAIQAVIDSSQNIS